MNVSTLLRPARRLASAATVGAVAVTVLASGGAVTGPVAGAAGSGLADSGSSAAGTGWHSTTDQTQDGTQQSASVELASVSAYPALSAHSYETKVLANINRVRVNHHLRKVRPASCADRVATTWSMHLASTNQFQHQSMQRLLKVCHASYVGEVLGRGSISPRKLVSMWMHSPPHHHILMSKSPRRIGIGATPNTRGEWVVAANFMTF